MAELGTKSGLNIQEQDRTLLSERRLKVNNSNLAWWQQVLESSS